MVTTRSHVPIECPTCEKSGIARVTTAAGVRSVSAPDGFSVAVVRGDPIKISCSECNAVAREIE
jgi:hypothetical protein